MMKFLQLIILAVSLSVVFLSSASNGQQLQTFLKTAEYVQFQYFEAPVPGDATIYRGGGIRHRSTSEFEQITAIEIAKVREKSSLYIAHNLMNEYPELNFDPVTLQRTHFLPYEENRGTYMQLSYAEFGDWFFTSQLSGCEIWIAHDRNSKTQPLIIHSNSFDCQHERKLTENVQLSTAALMHYNNKYNRHYELVHRVMWDIRDLSTDPDGYIKGFQQLFPHVQIAMYNRPALFYGRHRQPYRCEDDNAAYYGGWTFHLREQHELHLYQIRAPRSFFAHKLCVWLRYLTRGYIGGRHKREALSENTLCGYMTTTLSGHAQSRRLNLTDTGGTLIGSVPTDQMLSISELFPASYNIGAPFNRIPIDTVRYNCSSTELQINTRVLEALTVLPGILELSNVSISLNATLSPVGVQFFMFTANWGIGNINGHFTIEDNLETSQLLLRGGPQGNVGENFEDLIETLTGKRISLPINSVSFRDLEVFGTIDTYTGGSATFSISGKYGGSNAVHVVVQKGLSTSGTNYAGGLATEFTHFSFTDLIQELTGADISGVPFLGSLVVPSMAVTVSSATIGSSNLLQVFEAGSLLQLSGGYIQGGVTTYFHSSAVNSAPLKMSYFNRKFSFVILQGQSVSLDSLLSQVGLNLSSVALPGISTILNLNIMLFSINSSSWELFIDANFPNSLSYFGGLLKVENVVVSVNALLKSPRRISVEASGHLEIGNEIFDIYVNRDATTNKYFLSGQILELRVSDIIKEFETAVFPDELGDIIRSSGFFDFSIKNVGFSYSFGSPPLQIQISGSPVINGYEGPYLYMIIIKQGGTTKLIQGFELGTTNLSDLVKTISGFKEPIAFLNQQIEAAILISPVTLPGIRLEGKQLSGFSVRKGISLQATISWPPNCSSDLLCNVSRTLLGESARLMIQGTITNTRSFSLMAGVSDIQLSSRFTLKRAGFELRVQGTTFQIGIFGNLHIRDPDIVLNAAIRVGTRGVVLDFSMTGCWEQAFGADWLTICSLQGLVALKPEFGFLPGGLALGGEVKIGKPSCQNELQAAGFVGFKKPSCQNEIQAAGFVGFEKPSCQNVIQAAGFVGIDADTPQENYYYVNVDDELSFESVINKAFCLNVILPRPLAESGFPEGFLSSFSLFGKELPHVPLSIPQGFRMKGVFKILGLTTSVDIDIGLPRGLKAVVLLPPLYLADGLLTMYASKDDSSKGPYLNATIDLLPPNVNIEARGYVSVLGISVEGILRITNKHYQMHIEGRMLGQAQASLEITASYGSIQTASFRVQGRFEINLSHQIKGILDKALQASSDLATESISYAQSVVHEKEGVLNIANGKLTETQAEVNKWHLKLDSAVNALKQQRAILRGVCNPACPHVCVPAPCGTTCVQRVWGVCLLSRLTFSSCCFRAPDVVCEAEKVRCSALRETYILAVRSAETVLDNTRTTLDAVIQDLQLAKGVVNSAKRALNTAVAKLEMVKKAYRVGIEATKQIARFGLGGIVSLKEISFDVSLSEAAHGNFACSVKGILAGKMVEVTIKANRLSITHIARQIADHVIYGLSSKF